MNNESSIVWTPLNVDQHSLRSIYSIMMHLEQLYLLYAIAQVETIAGKLQSGEKERKRRERETVCWGEMVLALVINLTNGQISWSLEIN